MSADSIYCGDFLLILIGFLVRFVVTDRATGRRAEHAMMAGHMTGGTADDRTFDATLRTCGDGRRRRRQAQRHRAESYADEKCFHFGTPLFCISIRSVRFCSLNRQGGTHSPLVPAKAGTQ